MRGRIPAGRASGRLCKGKLVSSTSRFTQQVITGNGQAAVRVHSPTAMAVAVACERQWEMVIITSVIPSSAQISCAVP